MPFSYLRLTALLFLLGVGSSHATSGTWANFTGNADANWSLGTNWISGNIPGTTDLGTSNTDVATFNAAASVETPILDGSRRLDRVFIDNAQADYSILSSAPGNILYLQRITTTGNALAVVGGGTTVIAPEVRIGNTTQSWSTGSGATGNAAVTLAGGLSLTQTTTTLTIANLTPIVVQGDVKSSTTGSRILDLAGSGSMDITGNIQSTVGLNGTSTYTGTLRLSGNNSTSGTLTWRISKLELNNAGALGSSILRLGTAASTSAARAVTVVPLTIASAITTTPNATNSSVTLGGEHTSGTTVFSNTVTFDATDVTFGGFNVTAASGGIVDFSGQISGTNLPVFKVGTGAVRFTNSSGNTYLGTTTISAGALLVNNSSGSGTHTGAVTVNSTGTFGGTGSASGAVNVNAGGRLSPGDSTLGANARAGSLSIGGALAFAGSSNVTFDLNGTTAGDGAGFYDQIIAGNSVTLSGNVNFTLTLGIDPLDNGTQIFTLLDKTSVGAIAGSGLLNLDGSTLLAQGDTFTVGGQMFQISYSAGTTPATFLSGGNDIALLAIPEPGTAAILTLGLVALASSRRRR